MSSADANIRNITEAIDDYKVWEFDGAAGGKSGQSDGAKRRSQDLQEKCLETNEIFRRSSPKLLSQLWSFRLFQRFLRLWDRRRRFRFP